ncbi:hypothetical protein C8035_v010250 [Colletotrichum spinosum]|uniref:F-box protein n=1 Tax=Colletotrichum spinosum TaxID=1347390 RepID=A0A4R8QD98_9PEZI|nr:hypothetical protein C8035_v010250 [Colletotrichum spinosum]
MAKQMGLYVREGWEEYNWNTDIFIELAMLRAQNVRHVELEFHQLKGICRPSFEGLLPEHGDTTHIRLEKLEHLYLVKSGWRISDLDHVLDRAPSLNKLRLFVCDFKYPSTSLPTNLSDLCILRCPITPSRLISIIQQMERLSRLEFTVWRGQPEDLAKIVAALSKHSATLKSLTVCFGWNPRSGASRVKAPLETLTNLQSLTTDVRSFGLGPTGLVQSLPPALQRLRLIRSPETTEEDIQTFAYELQEAKRWGHEDLTVTSSGPKYWEDVDGKHDTAFQCKSVFLRA